MDFVLGLFTGYLLNWIALSVLTVVAVVCEGLESTKSAAFFGLLAAVVAILFFQLTAVQVAWGSILYACIGVTWSVWRYYRYVRAALADTSLSSSERERVALDVQPKNMTGRIVHWMVIWPVSMIGNLLGDFISLASSLVTGWLKGVYQGMYNRAVSKS